MAQGLAGEARDQRASRQKEGRVVNPVEQYTAPTPPHPVLLP